MCASRCHGAKHMSVWAPSSHAVFRLNKHFISSKTGPGILWKCDSCIHTCVKTWHHLPLIIFRRCHRLASAIYTARGCVNFTFYLKCALFVPWRSSKVAIKGSLWVIFLSVAKIHGSSEAVFHAEATGREAGSWRGNALACFWDSAAGYANSVLFMQTWSRHPSSSQPRLVWWLYNGEVLKCCVFAELVKHKGWNCALSTDINFPPTEC